MQSVARLVRTHSRSGIMKRFQRRHLALSAAAAAAVSVSFLSSASAATDVWTGASGIDGNWNTLGNWGTGVPASGDALIFDGANTTSVNNDTGFTINGITFNATAGAFTVS